MGSVRYLGLALLFACRLVASGDVDPSHVARSRPEPPPAGVDAELAKKAELVVRAKRVTLPKTRRKYAWYRVEVLKVLKNDTKSEPADFLEVAALGIKPGVPDGESILYLVPYNLGKGAPPWKLLGGGADEGVRRPPADSQTSTPGSATKSH